MRGDHSTSSELLLVRHGARWAAEQKYILDVLLGKHLGLGYEERVVPGAEWVEIRCPAISRQRMLAIGANLLLRPEEQRLSFAALPVLPLGTWDPMAVLPACELGSLPVLYAPVRAPASNREPENALFLPLDLFGGAFFLLARYEELVIQTRDKHGRFPAAASLAHRGGFLLRPLVDEYAELLRDALATCFPGLACRRHPARIRLTHDVDHPFQFYGKSPAAMMLSVGKGLYHDPRPRRAWDLAQAGVRAGLLSDPGADPFNTYGALMDASESLGTPAEFYFMTGVTNKRYDERSNLLDPGLQKLLRLIRARGHRVGLHSSYEASASEGALVRERDVLLSGLEHAGIQPGSLGGRQHYLRWKHPTSWRCWDAASLDYDATVGFADHIGFRCGTAREFPAFDPVRSVPLRLRERPLIAMDVAMTEYMGLPPDKIRESLKALWSSIQRLGGTFEVLIHNCNPLARWLATSVASLKEDSASEVASSCRN